MLSSNPIAELFHMHKIDSIDRRILRELQKDGSLRNDVLAERVALSPAPTLRRVRALEKAGVISGYVALVDSKSIGLGVLMKVDLRLASQTRAAIDDLAAAVASFPEVVECVIVLGDWDYHLTVVAKDVEDYQRFLLDHLSKLPGVATYRSTLVVTEIKRTTSLPL
jgi:Lrp/AsnC family transcriptional regulator, leucine-responsive regulatory protein